MVVSVLAIMLMISNSAFCSQPQSLERTHRQRKDEAHWRAVVFAITARIPESINHVLVSVSSSIFALLARAHHQRKIISRLDTYEIYSHLVITAL
jgi:hypothetical protein